MRVENRRCHNTFGTIFTTLVVASAFNVAVAQPVQLIEDCGVLTPGPQSCVLFTTDGGQSFAVNGELPGDLFDRVWITGTHEPGDVDCFPAEIPVLNVLSGGACFAECGRLVQGVECVLFQADAGGTYTVANLGAYGVGDRVYIRGALDPTCITFCSPTGGCVHDNTIGRCCDCPGDMNGDGFRDGRDIVGFVRCWLGPVPMNACACADINADGAVSADDVSLFVEILLSGTPCGNVGACCFDIDDGPLAFDTCELRSQAECELSGGVFGGAGTQCEPEACCLLIGYCQETAPECCRASGGQPQGAGSTCDTANCEPMGACCTLTTNITCHVFTLSECESFGGSFLGQGTLCQEHRACCLPDGSCLFIDIVCCIENGGTPGAAPGECFGEGACCLDIDDGPLAYDTCRVLDRVCCEQQGGVFQGIGSQCAVVACCLPTGGCQEIDPRCCVASGGIPSDVGQDCANAECPDPG